MAFNKIMQLASATVTKQLPETPTVVEWGNQLFRYNQHWAQKCGNISGKKIRHPVKFVWEYFEDLGFSNYLAIDINTNLRAVAMDLNFMLNEKYGFTEQFDLVTNNGTGEHIFNQQTVFENMHNLCKVGGTMLVVLPFLPWINHGFYNFNPCLFRDLVGTNSYEWNFLWLAENKGEHIKAPTNINSWLFGHNSKEFPQEYHQLIKPRNANKAWNMSIVAAYRKVNDKPFAMPMQGRYVCDMNEDIKKEYSDTNVSVKLPGWKY